MTKNKSEIVVSVIEPDLLMRQILMSMLRREDGIRLVGSSGFKGTEKGISKLKAIQPHLVLLAVDRMDSAEMKFFKKIRNELPEISVILLTKLNMEGAEVAIEGLKRGAVDYVTKPERRRSLLLAEHHFRKRVLPVVKSLPRFNKKRVAGKTGSVKNNRTVEREQPIHTGTFRNSRIELLVIGSCLGGVSSLYKVISGLPDDFPVPVVIIQHMPKMYTKQLANNLDEITSLHVREALNNSLLLPGQVYVAPGGYHSVIKNDGNRKKIFLHKGPREHRCRPSIDVMLRSAVQAFNGNLLSVFLSGGGEDGISGAREVLENGGTILIESRDSSLLWDVGLRIKELDSDITALDAESIADEIKDILRAGSGMNVSEKVAITASRTHKIVPGPV